jgi:hypothetical protein
VDLKKLTDEAKDLVDKRGGSDSLKEDAEELKHIVGGDDSLVDKAREAAEALRDPGAESPEKPAARKQGKPRGGEGKHRREHEGGGKGRRQGRP